MDSTTQSIKTLSKMAELLNECNAIYGVEYVGYTGSTIHIKPVDKGEADIRIDIPQQASKRELREILKPYVELITFTI